MPPPGHTKGGLLVPPATLRQRATYEWGWLDIHSVQVHPFTIVDAALLRPPQPPFAHACVPHIRVYTQHPSLPLPR